VRVLYPIRCGCGDTGIFKKLGYGYSNIYIYIYIINLKNKNSIIKKIKAKVALEAFIKNQKHTMTRKGKSCGGNVVRWESIGPEFESRLSVSIFRVLFSII
jgi:hypothetical protein